MYAIRSYYVGLRVGLGGDLPEGQRKGAAGQVVEAGRHPQTLTRRVVPFEAPQQALGDIELHLQLGAVLQVENGLLRLDLFRNNFV